MEELSVGNGGWTRYRSSALPAAVLVRFADRAGRLVPVELYVDTDDGQLDAKLLRTVPLGRIEAWANQNDGSLRAHLDIPGPDLRRLAGHFATTFGRKVTHWVARSMAAQIRGSGEPQAPPARAPKLLPADEDVVPGLETFRLEVPTGRDHGDDFYSAAALSYAEAARWFRGPAGVLAEANKVPVSTVHRWVKEARRRGFLPPGAPGKAG